jgi:hypothetical protein
LSLQPKEVGNDNRAEVKNDGFGVIFDPAKTPLEKIRARHGRRRDEFCAINTGA